jgi:hypothetical protein
MLQARPHALHFKRILDFGEGQRLHPSFFHVVRVELDSAFDDFFQFLIVGECDRLVADPEVRGEILKCVAR